MNINSLFVQQQIYNSLVIELEQTVKLQCIELNIQLTHLSKVNKIRMQIYKQFYKALEQQLHQIEPPQTQKDIHKPTINPLVPFIMTFKQPQPQPKIVSNMVATASVDQKQVKRRGNKKFPIKQDVQRKLVEWVLSQQQRILQIQMLEYQYRQITNKHKIKFGPNIFQQLLKRNHLQQYTILDNRNDQLFQQKVQQAIKMYKTEEKIDEPINCQNQSITCIDLLRQPNKNEIIENQQYLQKLSESPSPLPFIYFNNPMNQDSDHFWWGQQQSSM